MMFTDDDVKRARRLKWGCVWFLVGLLSICAGVLLANRVLS